MLCCRVTGACIKKTDGVFKYPQDHEYRSFPLGGKQVSAVRPASPLRLPPARFRCFYRVATSPSSVSPRSFSPRMPSDPLLLLPSLHTLTNDMSPIAQTTEAPLVFGNLRTTDEEDDACGDDTFLQNLGTIQLRYCRVKNIRVKKASKVIYDAPSSSKSVYEAAKKASSLSHQTGCVFVSALVLSPPPALTDFLRRYGATRQAEASGGNSTLEAIDSHNLPFSMIEFRYRSRRILEMEGKIPSTSPRLYLPLPHSQLFCFLLILLSCASLFISHTDLPAPTAAGNPAPAPVAGPSGHQRSPSPANRTSRSPSVEVAGTKSALDLKRAGKLDEDDGDDDEEEEELEDDQQDDGGAPEAKPAAAKFKAHTGSSSAAGGEGKAAEIAALKRRLAELEGGVEQSAADAEEEAMMRKKVKREEVERVENEKLDRRRRGIKPEVVDAWSDSDGVGVEGVVVLAWCVLSSFLLLSSYFKLTFLSFTVFFLYRLSLPQNRNRKIVISPSIRFSFIILSAICAFSVVPHE
jgi:hypothetical protein